MTAGDGFNVGFCLLCWPMMTDRSDHPRTGAARGLPATHATILRTHATNDHDSHENCEAKPIRSNFGGGESA